MWKRIIKENEGYCSGVRIQNKEYYFTFKYKINPYQVRICGEYKNYWFVFSEIDLNDMNEKNIIMI